MKKRTKEAIRRRKKGYTSFLKEKFILRNDSANGFYHCCNAITNVNRPPKWHVQSMYPDKPDEEITEILAKFFNDISAEKEPMNGEDVPVSFEEELPQLTETEVLNRLKKTRKPRSKVPGDIDPSLYDLSTQYLAPVITDIYNCILA